MTDITSSVNYKSDPPLYDLQEVIQQYQSQPELLKLILTSKVEEDKRRAEEAKLRAKELDLYFEHKHKKSHKLLPSISSTLKKARPAPYAIPPLAQPLEQTSGASTGGSAYRSYHSSSISSTSSSSGSISSLSELEDEDGAEDGHADHQQRRHSAAAAMLAMGGAAVSDSNLEAISNAYPSPIDEHYSDGKDEEDEELNKPRRRREMQAITKIVETREFPYIDNYFWKNNGNTVQKKTGCKSIYYKCSNSNKVRLPPHKTGFGGGEMLG
ncbi:hypothetical protein [Parasitella parasitica]|uniref:WRKY domain-containing protein n=1 Tax=Parasitella parasitica TaxID=35722 RepID=A0A0B7NW88_9FUNG|nr:hypothetical protein [Parasitella parasitica]